MTIQSHTELAADAKYLANEIIYKAQGGFEIYPSEAEKAGRMLLAYAAALELPERVPDGFVLVRSDLMGLLAERLGATPPPQAEKQPLSDEQHRAIWERESRDWAEGRNDNPYLAYGQAVERAHGIVTKEST